MHYDLIAVLLSQDFQHYFDKFGYIGIYVFFVTVDQIAPIPEEITLIIIGYFASQGIINPFLAGMFSLAAFATIDIAYYWLAKSGNKFVKKLTNKSSHNSTLAGYKKKIKENLPKTLLILSFIPRVRLLSPVFAALSGAPFNKFIIFNLLALALFISVYISLGYIFRKSMASLLSKLGIYQHIVFIIFIVLMVTLSLLIAKKIKSPHSKAHSHK